MTWRTWTARSGLVLVLGGASAGCSDSDNVCLGETCEEGTSSNAGSGGSGSALENPPSAGAGGDTSAAGGSAGSAGSGSSTEDGARYLVVTQIDAGSDMRQSYLNLTSSFDGDTEIDPTQGVEIQGYTLPVVFDGAVYVPDPLGPTLTRYTVNDAGALVEGERLSFAALGVSGVSGEAIHIVSADKAYLFDTDGLRAIVWNPTEMSLTGSEIDLSALERDGYRPFVFMEDFNKKVRGSRLFAPIAWYDVDFNSRYSAGVLVMDTESDNVVSVLDDDRCGDAWVSVAAPNGDLYFFPNAASAEEHGLSAETPRASCALRINAGEEGFDPTFSLDLAAAAGGSPAAQGAAPDGESGFFFAAADAERYADRENNDYTFWQLWHYDLETNEAEPVAEFPWWTGAIRYYDIDGRVILPRFEALPGWRTTFVELAPNPEATPFAVDASWNTVARVR